MNEIHSVLNGLSSNDIPRKLSWMTLLFCGGDAGNDMLRGALAALTGYESKERQAWMARRSSRVWLMTMALYQTQKTKKPQKSSHQQRVNMKRNDRMKRNENGSGLSITDDNEYVT